jgi:hypothetical protein
MDYLFRSASEVATISPVVCKPAESLVREFSFLRELSTKLICPSFGGGVFWVIMGLA